MKKILLITILMLIHSCSLHKTKVQTSDNEDNLSETEKSIVNDFLEHELIKERYKNYRDYNIVVIEEAFKKSKPLSVYEFNYKYKDSWGSSIKDWILDSLQINNIKNNLKDEEVYHWKKTDFRNIKVELLKYEELIKTTNTGQYLKNNLIIYLSRPLIIDENNAFVSFEIGNGDLGFYHITHFTALMQKVDGVWVQKGYYEDGVFN